MNHDGDRRFFVGSLGYDENCVSTLFTRMRLVLPNAAGKPRLSPLTKCMIALRQLACDTMADMFNEYLHVGDSTGQECLVKFCEGVVEAFSTTYLPKPNATVCQFLLDMQERVHDFPKILGSIDYMY